MVSDVKSLLNIIVPLFNTSPLSGDKYLNYMLWCKGLNIIKSGDH